MSDYNAKDYVVRQIEEQADLSKQLRKRAVILAMLSISPDSPIPSLYFSIEDDLDPPIIVSFTFRVGRVSVVVYL